ncbi:YhcH/YjgK/YiaL family protein [Niastella populi]|uniref:YhcH/YjgK/YiaL family protein n=1 Tax=Niastella populi TaxID=550983 RepID=UPI0009BF05C2|nr:YhcH/YjgK/YiaL family protein [Niastella populi]
MKKAFVLSSLLGLFSFQSINAQEVVDAAGVVDTPVLADTFVSASQVAKWYKKKEWLNGVALKPHKSINQFEFYRQYNSNKTYWEKAFAFLKEHDLKTLAKGKYPVDGDNVFVSVTEEPGKDFEKTNWESHRKYIDLQCVITGDEKMGKWPVAEATTITKPYDEAKDVANYTAPGKFHVVHAGSFIIFFPGEAHRPNITPGRNKVVKKIVIKVRAAQ